MVFRTTTLIAALVLSTLTMGQSAAVAQSADQATAPASASGPGSLVYGLRETAGALQGAVDAHVTALNAFADAIETQRAAREGGTELTDGDVELMLAERDARIAALEAQLAETGLLPAARRELQRLQEFVEEREQTIEEVRDLAREQGEVLEGFWNRLQTSASELGTQARDVVGREVTAAIEASEQTYGELKARLDEAMAVEQPSPAEAASTAEASNARISELEAEIDRLRAEIDASTTAPATTD
ncbi:MAG: hypothetical protein AAF692_05705 [Pseudomonadota bacterium]